MSVRKDGDGVKAGANFTARHESGHLIVRHLDDWCVMSADGQHTLKRAKSRDEALAWCDERFKAAAARHVHIIGATSGEVRTAEFAGAEYLVVPVVALVGDIAIWPMNAPSAEFVPLSVLEVAPAGWNGRPVCHNHPTVDGKTVSANSPAVLEATSLGLIFGAEIVDGRLKMEAWVSADRAEAVGAEAARTFERLKDGEVVEVSVGCFVVAERQQGTDARGRKYESVWSEIVPDHLALLEEGAVGACSVEAGCGVRAAQLHTLTVNGLEWGEEVKMPEKKAEAGAPSRSLRERLAALVPLLRSAQMDDEDVRLAGLYGGPAGLARLTGAMTDIALRGRLHDALRAIEPGFMWLEAVDPDEMQVVYCTQPEKEYMTWRRSYSRDGDNVTVNDDRTEVRMSEPEYEEVTAAGAQAAATGREAGCGCGGASTRETTTATATTEEAMNKTERIKALIANPRSPFKGADQAYLEGLPEERLAEHEQHAQEAEAAVTQATEQAEAAQQAAATAQADAKAAQAAANAQLSEEDWMKRAPASVRKVVQAAQAKEHARHTELVDGLKAAQSTYTEDELKAMSNEALEKLASLVESTVPEADFSGRAFPRAASAKADAVPGGWFAGKEQ